MQHTIQHQEHNAQGAFYIEQAGQRVAEMTYQRTGPARVVVDHTEVAPSLGGQGVGRQLLAALVAWARATGTQVVPECPYVKAQFDKDAGLRDVVASGDGGPSAG
jgi:predicted GNAT family acetyltransferase